MEKKRAAPDSATDLPAVSWNQILGNLKSIENARLAEKEMLSLIDRLHEKIVKHPSGICLARFASWISHIFRLGAVWGLKAAKKCRKQYSQTLEKAKEQLRLIEEISSQIARMKEEISQSADDMKKKKRKMDIVSDLSSTIPGASIPSTATSIEPGRKVAAKILKEGTPVWILAVVVKSQVDRDKYDIFMQVEDAETDVDSPDYKRKYRFGPDNIVALPTETDEPVKYPVGKWVLALYPDTSCFYRAKIIESLENNQKYLVEFEEDNNQRRIIHSKHIVLDPKTE